MADMLGVADGSHPNLSLTADEKRAYQQLFKEADPDGFGAVSGDVAVKFFERTKLAPDVLGQIWQIADTENRGFLTPAGFGVVLRLIGHAQAGRTPSAQLAASPAPLPRFNSGPGQQQAPVASQPPPAPASPSQSGGPPVRVPALAPDKVAEYSALFEKSGAENGALSGTVAKQIFERARLPNDVLGRIWNLADTQGRGFLDVTEFVVAMHMLASYKSGAMRGVPNTLPPGLYEAAARRPPPRMDSTQRPGSSGQPGISAIPAQYSGFQNVPPQSPIARARMGTPLSAQSTGDPWAVSAADKSRFDSVFSTVDTQGRGFISGEQAVEFFGNARLPEEALAQIWDLADINSDGVLNKDEFAVAMYLIRQQRGTRDGRGNLPPQLPAALIPPSMRKQQMPSPHTTAPAFEAAPVTKPRSAADDLFGLDVMSSEPQAAPQVAQSTGGTDAGPFANPKSAVPPLPTSSPPPSNFKPFIPSSTFGQSLLPQSTGPAAPGQAKAEDDLLGDADAEQSSKLTNDSAELGNLSNQVGTLSKKMTDLQTTRAQTENELAQNTSQKKAFQERLVQLRTAYEQEARAVKTLQEQLSASKNDTKKVQQEMAMLEGTHADLQTQHQQLSTALQADQQENAALKEKFRMLNAENEKLKPQIEKLKSDARQQKGLVAINKKQLATNEGERDRIRAEIAKAQQEIDEAARELEESNRHIENSQKEIEQARTEHAATPRSPPPVAAAAAIHSPTPRSPPTAAAAVVQSPTPSTSSNPFFRRQTSDTAATPPVTSPEPVQQRNDAFDNIFGPSFGVASAAPATSFGHETPTERHEEPIPSATPEAPVVVEPPPPATADQIKSSSLPFRRPLSREDSLSSSVKVAPSASRLSPSSTPRARTPETATTSPASHRPDGDPFGTAAPDEEQESVRQTLPRQDDGDNVAGIPGAFPTTEASRSNTPLPSHGSTAAVAAGLGAAGVAAGAGVAAAVAHDHKSEEKELPPPPAEAEASKNNNFDEFFGGPAHQRTPSEQAADFDSAFASMDKSAPTNGVPASNNKEFPDIQELDHDDESSSDEEVHHKGFDDDFNTHSGAGKESNAIGKQPEGSAAPGLLQAPRPTLETASTASSLPGFEQQKSPPTYNDAVPDDDPSHFPREYKGLLPEREAPTSPTMEGSSRAGTDSVASPSYGPEVGQPRRVSQNEVQSPPPTKSAPFDFDSAFANMGAAPVADDSESDYGDETDTHKKDGVDFDPSFESPASSARAAAAESNTRSFSAHNAVTTPPTTNGTSSSARGPAPTQPQADNIYSFDEQASRSAAPQQEPSTSTAAASGVSHDWDALFAPLNSPGSATSPSGGPGLSKTMTNISMQSTEIAPGTAAITANTALDDVSTDPATPTAINTANPFPSANFGAPQEAGKLARPQPGRALSAGTEHDDPILKRLTAMGWSRTDSLAALEKFDYNIDKAADYLTFRS